MTKQANKGARHKTEPHAAGGRGKRMVKLEWLDSFSIGIEAIDNDHKAILQIMQDVQEAIQSKEYDRCIVLLDDLVDLGTAHFLREEVYLAKVSYPYIEEHIQYHQDLLQKVKSVKAICNNVEDHGGIEECFNGMAEFLIDDIIAGDLQFKSYLEARGIVS